MTLSTLELNPMGGLGSDEHQQVLVGLWHSLHISRGLTSVPLEISWGFSSDSPENRNQSSSSLTDSMSTYVEVVGSPASVWNALTYYLLTLRCDKTWPRLGSVTCWHLLWKNHTCSVDPAPEMFHWFHFTDLNFLPTASSVRICGFFRPSALKPPHALDGVHGDGSRSRRSRWMFWQISLFSPTTLGAKI